MLNKETFPPDADMTYESFLDNAMHAADASAGFVSLKLFVNSAPVAGCQSIGTMEAVDWKNLESSFSKKKKTKIISHQHL